MSHGHALQALIVECLEDATTELREELNKVTRKVFVTHDNSSMLEVYGETSLKAYVPKRFNGFEVEFAEWDGEELTLDLDEELSLSG